MKKRFYNIIFSSVLLLLFFSCKNDLSFREDDYSKDNTIKVNFSISTSYNGRQIINPDHFTKDEIKKIDLYYAEGSSEANLPENPNKTYNSVDDFEYDVFEFQNGDTYSFKIEVTYGTDITVTALQLNKTFSRTYRTVVFEISPVKVGDNSQATISEYGTITVQSVDMQGKLFTNANFDLYLALYSIDDVKYLSDSDFYKVSVVNGKGVAEDIPEGVWKCQLFDDNSLTSQALFSEKMYLVIEGQRNTTFDLIGTAADLSKFTLVKGNVSVALASSLVSSNNITKAHVSVYDSTGELAFEKDIAVKNNNCNFVIYDTLGQLEEDYMTVLFEFKNSSNTTVGKSSYLLEIGKNSFASISDTINTFANRNSVLLNLNKGSLNNTVTLNFDNTTEYVLPVPTKENLDFIGWKDSSNPSGGVITKISSGTTELKVLNAYYGIPVTIKNYNAKTSKSWQVGDKLYFASKTSNAYEYVECLAVTNDPETAYFAVQNDLPETFNIYSSSDGNTLIQNQNGSYSISYNEDQSQKVSGLALRDMNLVIGSAAFENGKYKAEVESVSNEVTLNITIPQDCRNKKFTKLTLSSDVEFNNCVNVENDTVTLSKTTAFALDSKNFVINLDNVACNSSGVLQVYATLPELKTGTKGLNIKLVDEDDNEYIANYEAVNATKGEKVSISFLILL